MDNSGSWFGGFIIGVVSVAFVYNPFNSALVKEAKLAEKTGRTISNEIMQQLYPQSFEMGYPKYLERDFEAGADFICDELLVKSGQDICADDAINWR